MQSSYNTYEIDKKIQRVDERVDNEGRYYQMLAKRVAVLERKADHVERVMSMSPRNEWASQFPQEYTTATHKQRFQDKAVIQRACQLFLAELGSGNISRLREELSRKDGDHYQARCTTINELRIALGIVSER